MPKRVGYPVLAKIKLPCVVILACLILKANHRKTMVVDTAEGWKALVTSFNPHDGSSRHSNSALLVTGNTAVDVLKTEQAVARMSQGNLSGVVVGEFEADSSYPQVQVLTEQAILEASLTLIRQAKAQEHLDLAMFYLPERQIIQALIAAQQRGVQVRVLLTSNKDAFGREKWHSKPTSGSRIACCRGEDTLV